MSLTVACHRSGATGYMEQFLHCPDHGVVAEFADPVDLDAVTAAGKAHVAAAHAPPKKVEEPEPEKPVVKKAEPAHRGGRA